MGRIPHQVMRETKKLDSLSADPKTVSESKSGGLCTANDREGPDLTVSKPSSRRFE
jgi:hypothetical protein